MNSKGANNLALTFTFDLEDGSPVRIDIANEGVNLEHDGASRVFTWTEWNNLHDILEEWRMRIV